MPRQFTPGRDVNQYWGKGTTGGGLPRLGGGGSAVHRDRDRRRGMISSSGLKSGSERTGNIEIGESLRQVRGDSLSVKGPGIKGKDGYW